MTAALLVFATSPLVAAGQVGVLGRAASASPVVTAVGSTPQAWQPGRPQIRPAVLVDAELVRLGTDVLVTVDGATRVAHYEIHEEFRNVGHRLMEADYLYPVPAGAVFSNLSLFVGETELRGEMMRAEEARGIYEEIVRRRKDPALVELVGSGLVRTRVFPIEPGQTRKIILRYTQVLPREGDLLRLAYPRTRSVMVPVGPIEPMPREPMPQGRIAPAPNDAGGATIRVRVTGAGRFGSPVSPSHGIDWERPVRDEIELTADVAGADFELLLPLVRDEIGASLLVHSPDPGREEGYFLLLVTPPPHEDRVRIPRDMTLVLDVSGSMSGHKMLQARAALRQLLRGLTPDDRFRLVTFSSVVRSWRDGWADGTRETIDEAIAWLDTRDADGNTNIQDALVYALDPVAEDGRMSLVLFLTDGQPTASETDPEVIADTAARLRDGERVFAFGVGESVNTYLLDRLAEGGRGSVSYVAPDESVEAAVGTLARKIGTPALADLRIVESPVRLEELYPAPLPDLFHGEELMLLGRYREGGDGRLVIAGERAGEPVRLTFDLAFDRRRSEDEFIARLWASRKAGALAAHLRLHGPDAEAIEAIRDLGLRYGILTEYTAYLVEEPGMRNQLAAMPQAAAVAPAAQAGAESFRRARADADMRQARSLDEAEAAMEAVAPTAGEWRAELDDASAPAFARIGRRIFNRVEGVWTDARHGEDVDVIAIEPYGAAWFELLARFPALRFAAALGDSVIIAGEGVSLRLASGGAERLDRDDWQRIERAFAAER